MNYKKNQIKFGEIIKEADIRWLYDIKDVIYDKEWFKTQENFEIYSMYRNLYKNQLDRQIIESNQLRYDITVIPPNMIGSEFVKTAGHYHPIIKNSNLSYTEIYQVLEGRATYLLQKLALDNKSIEDFIIIKAEKGDCVIIPPNYGHVTVNESNETLKMANWVASDFRSEYHLISQNNGIAYFLTINGLIPNKLYNKPNVRYLSPVDLSEYGINQGLDMYNLIQYLDKLEFLKRPEDFRYLFSKIIY